MSSLSTLPVELIVAIASFLEPRELNCLLRTNRNFALILTAFLYRPRLYELPIEEKPILKSDDLLLRKLMRNCKLDVLLNYFRTCPHPNALDDQGRSLLHIAVGVNNRKAVEALIEAGANLVDESHRDVIVQAAKHPNNSLIRLLLDAGADPLASTHPEVGYSILLTGEYHRSGPFMKFLVDVMKEAGGNFDIKGKHGFNLLRHAVKRWPRELVQAILDLGASPVGNADINKFPLTLAAKAAKRGICGMIMNALKRTCDKDTVLQYAAYSLCAFLKTCGCYSEICRYFLGEGVDIIAPVQDYPCPFVTAIVYGRATAIRLMMDSRPDIDLPEQLHSALMWFIEPPYYYFPKGLECLLSLCRTVRGSGVDFSFQHPKTKDNILHCILQDGPDEEVDIQFIVRVHKLLDTGIDLTRQNNTGKTCLHYAFSKPYGTSWRKIVRTLIREAKLRCPELVNIADNDGVTPLHLAADHGSRWIHDLISVGADVNARDKKGWTPLHYAAAAKWQEDSVGMLLQRGADPRILDNEGLPPAHLAATEGRGIAPWKKILDEKGTRWHENCEVCGSAGERPPEGESTSSKNC